jgi:hypothetical protein
VAKMMKLREGKHNNNIKQNAEIKAIKQAEVKLVFHELEALEPVEKNDIPMNVKASHLFMVEKFTAIVEHNKFMSQLVSHGNE